MKTPARDRVGRPVEVIWLDSTSGGGWRPLDIVLEDDEPDDMLSKSLGYVVRDAPSFLTIVQSAAVEEVAGHLQIPRVAIREVRELVSTTLQ